MVFVVCHVKKIIHVVTCDDVYDFWTSTCEEHCKSSYKITQFFYLQKISSILSCGEKVANTQDHWFVMPWSKWDEKRWVVIVKT